MDGYKDSLGQSGQISLDQDALNELFSLCEAEEVSGVVDIFIKENRFTEELHG